MDKETMRPLGYTAPVRILNNLVNKFDEGNWLNNIARDTEMPVSTTAEALDRLEKLGWITSDYNKTKRVYYFNIPDWYYEVFKQEPTELFAQLNAEQK